MRILAWPNGAGWRQMLGPALEAGIALIGLVTLATLAQAGTDTSFDTALGQISAYLEGSLGQLLAVAALIGGLVGMVIFGFRLGQVAVPVAICVAAATGIPIVTAAVTAVV